MPYPDLFDFLGYPISSRLAILQLGLQISLVAFALFKLVDELLVLESQGGFELVAVHEDILPGGVSMRNLSQVPRRMPCDQPESTDLTCPFAAVCPESAGKNPQDSILPTSCLKSRNTACGGFCPETLGQTFGRDEIFWARARGRGGDDEMNKEY